jgi:hypothetical protein
MYRIYNRLFFDQCNCCEPFTPIIIEVIDIQKTLKMTSCTEFSKANLLDIVTYELTWFDIIEKYNRLLKILGHIRADITDLN